MNTEQSMPNGTRHLFAEKSLGDEFQESVLPQITGLLSDAEAVLRNESRLVEARILDRVHKIEQRFIFSFLGAGAYLAALVLFLVTVVLGVTTTFPEIPVWQVTGALCLVTCLAGAFLMSSSSHRSGGN